MAEQADSKRSIRLCEPLPNWLASSEGHEGTALLYHLDNLPEQGHLGHLSRGGLNTCAEVKQSGTVLVSCDCCTQDRSCDKRLRDAVQGRRPVLHHSPRNSWTMSTLQVTTD